MDENKRLIPDDSDNNSGSADLKLGNVRQSSSSDLDWMKQIAPTFYVNGDQITILHKPNEFYETLMSLSKSAKKRIVFASLYLGTGQLEQSLVDSLHESLRQSDRGVRIHILLDYSRGLRGDKNSCSMLETLKAEHGERVRISFFHTPHLRDLLKKFLPDRWNEIVGVQHMKLYIFDDAILLSGANLSNDYFVDRQDRYILVESADLANFYEDIINAVGRCSFVLDSNGDLSPHNDCKHHPFQGDLTLFCNMMKTRIDEVFQRWQMQTEHIASPSDLDTRIYGLVQMGPVGVNTEDDMMQRILTHPVDKSTSISVSSDPSLVPTIDFASGYFNLTSVYEQLILRSPMNYNILLASPKANGFFAGKGASGYVPGVYVEVSKMFFNKVNRYRQKERITLYEYAKNAQTFHAKGIWLTFPKESLPSATLIGSTNYGHRSVFRDLEAQIVLVTSNERLRVRLKQERDALFKNGARVDTTTFELLDHRVPLWVRIVSRFFRHFF